SAATVIDADDIQDFDAVGGFEFTVEVFIQGGAGCDFAVGQSKCEGSVLQAVDGSGEQQTAIVIDREVTERVGVNRGALVAVVVTFNADDMKVGGVVVFRDQHLNVFEHIDTLGVSDKFVDDRFIRDICVGSGNPDQRHSADCRDGTRGRNSYSRTHTCTSSKSVGRRHRRGFK